MIFIAEFFTKRDQVVTSSWIEFAGRNFERVCDEAATVLEQKYGSDIETVYYTPKEGAMYRCLDVHPETGERMFAQIYMVQTI